MKVLLTLSIYMCLGIISANAQNKSNDISIRSTIGVSGTSEIIKINSKEYLIQQSIGQSSPIGFFKNGTTEIRQGFIQPLLLAKIMDKNIPLNLEVLAYPNPFLEYISLLFKTKIESDIHISIYDVLGRLLFEKTYAPAQNIKIDLSYLSDTQYILKANANNKQIIKKLLKS